MFTAYILQSKLTGRFYSGSTEDAEARLLQHNAGKYSSTKRGIPWKIVFAKTFATQGEALAFECKIKARGAKRFLDDMGLLPG